MGSSCDRYTNEFISKQTLDLEHKPFSWLWAAKEVRIHMNSLVAQDACIGNRWLIIEAFSEFGSSKKQETRSRWPDEHFFQPLINGTKECRSWK
jgi:hypothetical protein